MKTRKLLTAILLLIMGIQVMYAQRTITGVVTDEQNLPLPGVNVLIQGTTSGTVTDLDGRYTIEVPSEESVLVYSSVGFTSQEVRVGNQTSIDISLAEDIQVLEEVQVIAYGVKTKATVTGAISSVETDDLLKSTSPNVANILSGQMTGISTVQYSGAPGRDDPQIWIRGQGTLSGGRSHPLILVDGVERQFSQIDPNEIANVTILKDASATAVFGVRGANGVILITTRRGETGKPRISFTTEAALMYPHRIMDPASSYDHARLYNKMYVDDGAAPPIPEETVEAFRTNRDPLIYPNNPLTQYLIKDVAPKFRHNLNLSGGIERARYFVSLGWLDQKSMFEDFDREIPTGFDYKRFNYRANLDLDITRSTVLSLNIGGYYGKRGMADRTIAGDVDGGVITWFRWLMEQKSFYSPGIVDGKMIRTNGDMLGINTGARGDPLYNFWGGDVHNTTRNNTTLDVQLTQDLSQLVQGLEFSVKGSYNNDYSINTTRTHGVEVYMPWYLGILESRPADDPNFYDVVYEISGSNRSYGFSDNFSGYDRDWYLEARLFYQRTFGDHSVTGLALYNQQKNYYFGEPRHIPRSYLGLVGRITYDYQTKYLLDINMGYNGSENFAPGKTRYGFFPSFSAGWVVSEESFMQSLSPVISYLKLRGSVGMVGNDQGVSRFMYIPGAWEVFDGSYGGGTYWGARRSYNFSFTPNLVAGVNEGRFPNEEVTWETATKQNYGIDLTIASRLRVNFDYFFENRTDILISRNTAPRLLAFDLPNVNLGQVENRGYEIELEWRGGNRAGFMFTIRPNLSFARNKIIEADEIIPVYDYQKSTGGPTGRQLGYGFDRFYEEGDFNPDGSVKDGVPKPPGINPLPGDPLWVDKNGDGVLDGYDHYFIGYGERPEYMGGLNLGAMYKGISFTAQFTGATHVNREPTFECVVQPFGADNKVSMLDFYVENHWTPERGQDALLPRPTNTRAAYSYGDSELFTRDHSYIRLRNVQLAYTFQQVPFLTQIGVKRLMIYANGTNLFTLDRIKWWDPENFNLRSHPIMTEFALGLNVNF